MGMAFGKHMINVYDSIRRVIPSSRIAKHYTLLRIKFLALFAHFFSSSRRSCSS